MSTITKEQIEQYANAARLIQVSDFDKGKLITVAPEHMLELARIALASLESEPVAYIRSAHNPDGFCFADGIHPTHRHQRLPLSTLQDGCYWKVTPLYTAPPAPVEDTELQRKAAIHDVLCQKYKVESLTDFVAWHRNHIAELEAAPPAPVGPGETAVMPDYPGYVMTQRECYQAGKKAGLAEAVNSPVTPDGWVMVPVEPTEDMIVNGFESEPDESFSDEREWEAYYAMSGCQQAAHRAKLCWAAMIASAPKPEA